MITLKDGPAQGSYLAKQAPTYLRAVVDRATDRTDLLDQPEDVPETSGEVHIYRKTQSRPSFHLKMRRPHSGFYASADYEHMPGEDGESLRGNTAWRAWMNTHGTTATATAEAARTQKE